MSIHRSSEAETLSQAEALCLLSVRVKTWAHKKSKAKVSIFNLGSSKGKVSSQSSSRLRGYGIDLFLCSLWYRTSIMYVFYCDLLSLIHNFHPTNFICLGGFIILCPWLTITFQNSTVSRYSNSKNITIIFPVFSRDCVFQISHKYSVSKRK